MNYNLIETFFPRSGLGYQMINKVHFKIVTWLNWILNGHFFTRSRIREYYRKNNIIKVQFGSANKFLDGFLNTGIPGKIHIDITKNLPFKDNSVDLIFNSHLAEHIERNQFKHFLRDTYRILKKGGVHIIATPSIEKCAHILYCKGKKNASFLKNEFRKFTTEPVSSAYFLQGVSHMYYHHKFIYDLEEMTLLAKKAGYKSVHISYKENIFGFNIGNYLKKENRYYNLQTEVYILQK